MAGNIDWSCKHNVLIKNADGSYSRMDEPFYEAELICNGVWKILSSGDYHYCVAGKEKAVAIDTGYGAGNVREYLEKLTGMSVPDVINTHSHFDHTANNGYFDRAYMHPNAIKLATVPFASFFGIDFITDYERVAIDEDFVYELDDKELTVFFVGDHSDDGIFILDKADGILFIGDEIMSFGKSLKKVSVKQENAYLKKAMAHRGEFDTLCGGGFVGSADYLDRLYKATEAVLGGDEGILDLGSMRKPEPLAPGPGGETVYDRMMPHFGDGGFGKEKENHQLKYRKEVDGVTLIYNHDNIF